MGLHITTTYMSSTRSISGGASRKSREIDNRVRDEHILPVYGETGYISLGAEMESGH